MNTNIKKTTFSEVDFSETDNLLNQLRKVKNNTSNVRLFRPTKETSLEQPKKIFGPLWAESETAYLFGEDGTGKSVLAKQIGCAIATATSINGFVNELPKQNVVLFDVELSDYQFNTRYREGWPAAFKRFTFSEDRVASLSKANLQYVVKEIEATAMENNSRILILDNLSALMTMADLTKSDYAIHLMGSFNELKKKGFSILIIDHSRKPQETKSNFKTISKHDLQGSKMKTNLADSVFGIGMSCQHKDLRYIKALKIRSFPMEYTTMDVALMELKKTPLRLEFIAREFEWDHVNDQEGQVKRMKFSGKTQAQISAEVGITQQAVSKILSK